MKTPRWSERIDRAKRARRFQPREMKLAQDWPSCAIGEMLGKDAPAALRREYRTIGGETYLKRRFPGLYDLGYRFYRAVQNGNVSRASETYGKIRMLTAALFNK